MGAKVSLQKETSSGKEPIIRRMRTIIQEDYEMIGTAQQQGSKSAAVFRKKLGINTGFSKNSVESSLSPRVRTRFMNEEHGFRKNDTIMSRKQTIFDDEERKSSPKSFHFTSMKELKQSRAYIEDVGSVHALLGADFFSVDPISPRRYLRFNSDQLDADQVEELELVVQRIDYTCSKLKLLVHSQIPMDEEKSFEEKTFKVQIIELDNNHLSSKNEQRVPDDQLDHYMTSKHFMHTIGISISCRKGICMDGFNQDNYFMYADHFSKILIVTDGHGPFGGMVSFFVSMSLAKSIVENIVYITDPVSALKCAFMDCNKDLMSTNQRKNKFIDTALSGASVTAVIIRDKKIFLGHIGDTKAMLGRRSKNKKSISLYPLTMDHIPAVAEEKKRIYEKGGEVRRLTTSTDEKIFVRGRFFPSLTTTRSLGDDIGRLIGVIPSPDIITYEISPSTDAFLMIGTDSFFSYIEDNEILNILNFATAADVASSTEILVKKAKNAWLQAGMNYDDITLALCYL